MNVSIRRFCQGTPILRDLYAETRSAYHRRRLKKAAEQFLVNVDDYAAALEVQDGKIVNLHTKGGLKLTIRRNYMDAVIVGEMFFDKCYLQGFSLPDRPTVVDIGGYIGDFALYAAKCLNAKRVVVCEPSPSNWALLRENVANNHCEDRVEAVNKAVTDGGDIMMDVNVPDRAQARISAYSSRNEKQQRIAGITLAGLVEEYELQTIDLLKIDCEGGEYAILASTPTEVFDRVRNIVFEYHEIEGFQTRLEAAKRRLVDHGYCLKTRGSLVSATREQGKMTACQAPETRSGRP